MIHLRDLIAASPLSGAYFSDDPERTYRWALWRIWDRSRPLLLVSMLNPSTADHRKDDPTMQRVIRFAKRDGFGGIIVLNAYAFRSPHPKVMFAAADPDGPANQFVKYQAVEVAVESAPTQRPTVLLAHGSWGGEHIERTLALYRTAGCRAVCLGTTSNGSPKHPLARGRHRIPDDAPMVPWASPEVW